MRKKQGLARVSSVEIPEALADTFTVFTWDVSELNENGEIVVNNGSREYSSLSDPYVGTAATEDSSRTRMVSRLARDIEDGNLEFGSLTSELPANGMNVRNSKRR